LHNGASAPFTLTSDPTTTAAPRPTLAARYGPDWPIYGYNLARTRNASDLTMIHPPYRVVWKTGQLGILEYPPSYRRGVLYLTTDAGWASARSVFTGKVIWRRRFKPLVGEPTLYRGRVYFGSYDDRVYALDQETGKTVWSTRMSAVVESPPAVLRGILYIADLAGYVRALKASTGRVLWPFPAAGAVK